ncbi:MAG: nucleotidyltransferase domain-containing protein [Bacilli bacterium]|nr:nucleotidyltransferase domain-containing protein [Bacilli bacterium]
MKQIDVHDIINKFIKEMDYENNEHVLGVYFYGSYQLGCANEKSDIDLHVIFDDSNPKHIIRGNHFIDGKRIEYFEKPLKEMYLTIMLDFKNQSNALLAIVGNSEIIMDKTGELYELSTYAKEVFEHPLPKLTENDAKEYVSILNNRMEKLDTLAHNGDLTFYHLYHLTIEKIRKFYHRVIGSPEIQTTKVIRIYTDDYYRELINKGVMPEQEFIDMYIDAICDSNKDMFIKLEKAKKLYSYAKRSIDLDEKSNYRIPIRSRSNEIRR